MQHFENGGDMMRVINREVIKRTRCFRLSEYRCKRLSRKNGTKEQLKNRLIIFSVLWTLGR